MWIAIVLIAVIAGAIAYVYFTNQKKTSINAIPMAPDEYEKIVTERMIREGIIPGYYDSTGSLQVLDGTKVSKNKRMWTPVGTSFDFCAIDYEIQSPLNDMTQYYTTFANLNKDKKLVEQGMYSFHSNINFFQWVRDKSFFKKIPVSTPQNEAMMMYQLAAEQGVDISSLPNYQANQQQATGNRDAKGHFAEDVQPADDSDSEDSERMNYPPRDYRKTYKRRY